MKQTSQSNQSRLLIILTLMLSGRAMTLAFIAKAGSGLPGDPPAAWLMPLIGDAIVGLSALVIAYFIWNGRSLYAWVTTIVWNVVAIWDALSAWIIHLTAPWPEFFMIEIFGSSMFFMAAAMHVACIGLVTRPSMKDRFFSLKEQ